MKRILVNDIGYLVDGTRIAIISKITLWQKSGCVITIFCPQAGKKFYEQHLKGVNFIVVPGCTNSSNNFILIIELLKRNIIAMVYLPRIRARFDTVYSVSAILDMVLFPFMLKILDNKIKWVVVFDNAVSYHDPEKPLIDLLSFIFYKLSVLLLKKADTIFAVTESMHDYLLRIGFKPQKIITTNNAVEVELINAAKMSASLHIDALFMGRINKSKGIYDLLEVVKIVKRKYDNFQLAIMGQSDSATFKEFKSRIEQYGLTSNIQFLGYRSDIDKYTIIKSSKVFISLSKRENFSIALLEAVCSGLRAIAYNLEDSYHARAYAHDEVVFVPKNDYSKAAQELLNILGSGNFVNTRGIELLKKYNWDTIAGLEMKNL